MEARPKRPCGEWSPPGRGTSGPWPGWASSTTGNHVSRRRRSRSAPCLTSPRVAPPASRCSERVCSRRANSTKPRPCSAGRWPSNRPSPANPTWAPFATTTTAVSRTPSVRGKVRTWAPCFRIRSMSVGLPVREGRVMQHAVSISPPGPLGQGRTLDSATLPDGIDHLIELLQEQGPVLG